MDGRGAGPEPVATVRSLEGRAEENKKPTGGAGGEGTTEAEMAGWHHRLNRHEFEYTRGVRMDTEAWHAVIHGVAKSQTRLSN